MLDFIGDLQRSQRCGELRASNAGKKAVLMGWVNNRRDFGNLLFVDVRDRSGIAQIVFEKETSATAHEKAGGLRNEYVIAAVGTVKLRDASTINKNIPTGEVELRVGMFLLIVEASRSFTVPTAAMTYSFRKPPAFSCAAALVCLSKTICAIPDRSRTSTNSKLPKSRRLFTHPIRTAFLPASDARSSPHRWERCRSPIKSSMMSLTFEVVYPSRRRRDEPGKTMILAGEVASSAAARMFTCAIVLRWLG